MMSMVVASTEAIMSTATMGLMKVNYLNLTVENKRPLKCLMRITSRVVLFHNHSNLNKKRTQYKNLRCQSQMRPLVICASRLIGWCLVYISLPQAFSCALIRSSCCSSMVWDLWQLARVHCGDIR